MSGIFSTRKDEVKRKGEKKNAEERYQTWRRELNKRDARGGRVWNLRRTWSVFGDDRAVTAALPRFRGRYTALWYIPRLRYTTMQPRLKTVKTVAVSFNDSH